MKKCWLIILPLIIVLFSCEEVVMVDLPPAQNLLVVEGQITDREEHQFVRLSASNGFSDQNFVMSIPDASVTVESRAGEIFTFSHLVNGVYQSSDRFQGIYNVEYRVRIQLVDDMEILSKWERMMERVPISSLSTDSFLENDPENPNQQIAVFFPKISVQDPPGTRNFYRWIFFKNGELYSEPETITLQDDRFFDGNLIPNNFQNFGYERNDTIVVEFQSITKEAYEYLELLKSQLTTLGTTSGTTPANVEGNIDFVSGKIEANVLGYFRTVAVSSDTTVSN